eukprot:3080665-Prymnesium_polylepis.1
MGKFVWLQPLPPFREPRGHNTSLPVGRNMMSLYKGVDSVYPLTRVACTTTRADLSRRVCVLLTRPRPRRATAPPAATCRRTQLVAWHRTTSTSSAHRHRPPPRARGRGHATAATTTTTVEQNVP